MINKRFTTINVSHCNEKHMCPVCVHVVYRFLSNPSLFRSISSTFDLLCNRCAQNRVCQNVSKTHPCSCPANDRSRKITHNLSNFDCKATEDSVRSVSRSSNVNPATLAKVGSSSTSPMVKRNCPGSRIRRRTSTKPTNVDPVVLLDQC